MSRMTDKFIISLFILIALTPCSSIAVEQKPLKIKAETTSANLDMIVKDNFIKAKFASAENRFAQSNVKAAYDDFNDIIERANHDDYVFLSYAIKMAEYGFFDLSEKLINKLDVNNFTAKYVKDIKKYYYPSGIVKDKDLIYLADAYSNIMYNNMAIETTSELLNSNIADNSDYKNYLIALGYYKSNNLNKSLKYINDAITQNDSNINYLVLKTKILADSEKNSQALKLLNKIKKEKFNTVEFQQKINSLDEYILYKTAKNETLKDYHLAYYYHLQNKSLLATKVLQSAILQAKQYSPLVFSLLGKIYYENDEPLKAQEFAGRAFKEDDNNYLAALTLADLSFDNRKYDKALKYYKKAKNNSKDIEPLVGIAKSYYALEKDKKSKKLYDKLLKNNQYDENLLIESLQIMPQKADYYLPKVVSVDITNIDVWLSLANLAIRDQNYSMAITYLNNAFYIDSNNFKYYYYLSLVLRAKGEIEQANQSLIRCSRLNSDYVTDMNAGYTNYEK